MTYSEKTRSTRLEFWLGPSKWNRTTFTRLFSVFSDAIDIDQTWSSKRWNDYAMKLFSTACDAVWIHRLENRTPTNVKKMLKSIQASFNERYPDRSSKAWEVPRINRTPTDEIERRASEIGFDFLPSSVTSTKSPEAGTSLKASSTTRDGQNVDQEDDPMKE